MPLDYEQPAAFSEGPTLTLDGLTAGRYTVQVMRDRNSKFKRFYFLKKSGNSLQVTVTDSDGESDSATSKISVEEEKDYPPTANAGEHHRLFNPISTQFSSQFTVGNFYFCFFPGITAFFVPNSFCSGEDIIIYLPVTEVELHGNQV